MRKFNPEDERFVFHEGAVPFNYFASATRSRRSCEIQVSPEKETRITVGYEKCVGPNIISYCQLSASVAEGQYYLDEEMICSICNSVSSLEHILSGHSLIPTVSSILGINMVRARHEIQFPWRTHVDMQQIAEFCAQARTKPQEKIHAYLSNGKLVIRLEKQKLPKLNLRLIFHLKLCVIRGLLDTFGTYITGTRRIASFWAEDIRNFLVCILRGNAAQRPVMSFWVKKECLLMSCQPMDSTYPSFYSYIPGLNQHDEYYDMDFVCHNIPNSHC